MPVLVLERPADAGEENVQVPTACMNCVPLIPARESKVTVPSACATYWTVGAGAEKVTFPTAFGDTAADAILLNVHVPFA